MYVCVSAYRRHNRRTDNHQTWSADATHYVLESDCATPFIKGRLESDIKVQIEV